MVSWRFSPSGAIYGPPRRWIGFAHRKIADPAMARSVKQLGARSWRQIVPPAEPLLTWGGPQRRLGLTFSHLVPKQIPEAQRYRYLGPIASSRARAPCP